MHKPVLVDDVIDYLNIKPGSQIIDATLNGGGHASEILDRYPNVKILGIEFDPDIFQKFLKNKTAENITAVNDSYVRLKNIIDENNFSPDGILFDLGISSFHIEQSGRGFSFSRDEDLDMRFNPNVQKLTAFQIVNYHDENHLKEIIRVYGEEKFSSEISKAIVRARKEKPILKTAELADIVRNATPRWYQRKKIHPATKTFQAIRIEVNDEINNITKGIDSAIDSLSTGGRLAVISFHGVEDKTVREIFKKGAKDGTVKWVVRKTIRPSWEEIKENPRARSAKMKVVERI